MVALPAPVSALFAYEDPDDDPTEPVAGCPDCGDPVDTVAALPDLWEVPDLAFCTTTAAGPRYCRRLRRLRLPGLAYGATVIFDAAERVG